MALPCWIFWDSAERLLPAGWRRCPQGFATLQTLEPNAVKFSLATPALCRVGCLALILFWAEKAAQQTAARAVCGAGAGQCADCRAGAAGGYHRQQSLAASRLPGFRMLTLDLNHLSDLLAPALTIALLGAIESFAVRGGGRFNDRRQARCQSRADCPRHRQWWCCFWWHRCHRRHCPHRHQYQ